MVWPERSSGVFKAMCISKMKRAQPQLSNPAHSCCQITEISQVSSSLVLLGIEQQLMAKGHTVQYMRSPKCRLLIAFRCICSEQGVAFDESAPPYQQPVTSQQPTRQQFCASRTAFAAAPEVAKTAQPKTIATSTLCPKCWFDLYVCWNVGPGPY